MGEVSNQNPQFEFSSLMIYTREFRVQFNSILCVLSTDGVLICCRKWKERRSPPLTPAARRSTTVQPLSFWRPKCIARAVPRKSNELSNSSLVWINFSGQIFISASFFFQYSRIAHRKSEFSGFIWKFYSFTVEKLTPSGPKSNTAKVINIH